MAVLLTDLGALMRMNDEDEEAAVLLKEAIRIQRGLYTTEDHPDIARTIGQLAIVVRQLGDYEEAERLTRESLNLKRKIFGEEHADVAQALNSLAIVLKDRGKEWEAERTYREALAMKRKVFGERHEEVASTLNNLAALLKSSARYAEAEPLYLEALAIFQEHLGVNHRKTGFVRARVVELYDGWDKPAEADRYRN